MGRFTDALHFGVTVCRGRLVLSTFSTLKFVDYTRQSIVLLGPKFALHSGEDSLMCCISASPSAAINGVRSLLLPTSSRNIATRSDTKKPEWCGYQKVGKVWEYVYSFRHNTRTWQTLRWTDGRTPYDAWLAIGDKKNGSARYVTRCYVIAHVTKIVIHGWMPPPP